MEEFLKLLKFDEKGLVPVVVQDHISGEVLMVAYMNSEALQKTMETGMAHYWSRSRQKLWFKGETSGHYQYVKSVNIDCDGDTLLIRVEQKESACHTGHHSCFYREIGEDGITETDGSVDFDSGSYCDRSRVLQEVYDVITDRTIHPKEGSYTNYLFEKGIDKMLKKVGEEAAEVIIAAKNNSKDEIRYEIADLFYHILVVMVERGLKPDDIYNELKRRR
jgi:phosphoribosyl-ATP pyrophosphohydrolase/phosphoribosyl-AMP cyclohydrolase